MTHRLRLGTAVIRPEPAPTVNRNQETAVTTHICELGPSDEQPESARALLWRHGLPEDIIDGALALFAQELAGKIRAHRDHTLGATQATKVMDFAADLISPEHWARTEPAVVSAPVPPTDQTAPAVWIDCHPQLEAIATAVWEQCGRSDSGLVIDDPRNIAVAALAAITPNAADPTALRDRIRRAVCEAEGFMWNEELLEPDEYGEVADAVLAVLPTPADRAALQRVRTVLETEAVVGRSALEYRGLITSALMAAEARGAQQDEAHPAEHSWAAELYDPLAKQWAPGTRYRDRDRAVNHLNHAAKIGPAWKDGTPTQRRLVRTTTTYTVEIHPDQPRYAGGNGDDCPACQTTGLDTIGYPYECPGNGEQQDGAQDRG